MFSLLLSYTIKSGASRWRVCFCITASATAATRRSTPCISSSGMRSIGRSMCAANGRSGKRSLLRRTRCPNPTGMTVLPPTTVTPTSNHVPLMPYFSYVAFIKYRDCIMLISRGRRYCGIFRLGNHPDRQWDLPSWQSTEMPLLLPSLR